MSFTLRVERAKYVYVPAHTATITRTKDEKGMAVKNFEAAAIAVVPFAVFLSLSGR